MKGPWYEPLPADASVREKLAALRDYLVRRMNNVQSEGRHPSWNAAASNLRQLDRLLALTNEQIEGDEVFKLSFNEQIREWPVKS